MISIKINSIITLPMFVSKTVESEILVTAGAFSGHVGSNSEDYEDQHGGYD